MKAHNLNIKAFSILLCVALFGSINLSAQGTYKARVSVDYMQLMGKPGYLNINVKYKDENKKYQPGTDITLQVYQEVAEDSLIHVGSVTTNSEGNAKYVIEGTPNSYLDTVIEQNYVVKIENSDRFKKAKKKVDFVYSFLTAKVVEIDSVNHVEAELLDASGNPLSGEKITVQVKRLFGPLTIGESYYKTDESGKILVALEDDIYSRTGEITFDIFIDDRDLGIVRTEIESSVGTPMEDLSTFNQRTMWSPPGKTPIFLLVFANALIFGIWIVIFIIIINLFKINKAL